MLTACSFATTKWAAPGRREPALRRAPRRRPAATATTGPSAWTTTRCLRPSSHDLDDLLGLDGDPSEVRVSRWRDGFPQYEPGHLDRVAADRGRRGRPTSRGVAVAGAAYRGIGIPACIRQATAAAAQLVARG